MNSKNKKTILYTSSILVVIILTLSLTIFREECEQNQVKYKKCPDGSIIEERICINGEFQDTGNTCSSEKGWIQIAPQGRYFQFENGEQFFPIGHNLGPDIYLLTPEELEQHFIDMKANGENVLRFPLEMWIEGEPYLLEDPIGNFNEEHARRIDTVFELAEKHDIYLSVRSIEITNWFSDHPEDSPYLAKNGGPLPRLEDWFRHEETKEAFKNKLVYVSDRWGSSPSFFIYDIWGEINWQFNYGQHEEKRQWTSEMARFLTSYEMNKYGKTHIKTVGTGQLVTPFEFVFTDPNLDYVSNHNYGDKIVTRATNTIDIAIDAKNKLKTILNQKVLDRRPFMDSEHHTTLFFIGTAEAPLDEELEHNVNWAYISSCAGGKGLTWINLRLNQGKELYENLKPQNRAISNFMKNIDLTSFNPEIYENVHTTDENIETFACSDRDTTILWVLQKDYKASQVDMIQEARNRGPTVSDNLGIRVFYLMEWWDLFREADVELDLEENIEALIQLSEVESRGELLNILENPRRYRDYLFALPQENMIGLLKEIDEIWAYFGEVEEENPVLTSPGYPEKSIPIVISGLKNQEYEVTWYNDYTGQVISKVSKSGPVITLKTPTFQKHIVALIKPK